MQPSVLVVSFSDLARDPRVDRQLRWLSGAARVTAAGLAAPEAGVDAFVPLRGGRTLGWQMGHALLLACRRFDTAYWRTPEVADAEGKLAGRCFDVIVANDANTLPLAVRLARACGARLLFDAHEYEPLRLHGLLNDLLLEPYWTHHLTANLPCADAAVTVSQGIAEKFSERFGVHFELLTNAPEAAMLEPVSLRTGAVRLVHHGASVRQRRIGDMIQLMDRLDDRFSLDLLLLPAERNEHSRLERMAAQRDNVRILPPVPMRDICRTLNAYDVGLYMLPPTSFNHRQALPNKFFEFLQARLGIAVWPSPEMARWVRRLGCGVACDDFSVSSMAHTLNTLTNEEISQWKRNAHKAAPGQCAEVNRELFLSLVRRLEG